ncbi:MAG: response regulator [Deltaproteobacteria bacterium]|nr:response regulator [Deltaproteobacteria bacterium]
MGDLELQPLVLYVDDERANRIVFEQSLGSDFRIKSVSDGPAALAILDAEDVAALVTDMRMPGMSGEELLRIAKERKPATIRMVVTAYADVDPILRAINEGLVARYIIKPWIRAELVQVLRWAIEAWTFTRNSTALYARLMETERLATLGSIAGMLVHDLKQPLMSLLINVEHLRELAKAAPILQDSLSRTPLALEEKTRLSELVDDLDPVTTDLKASAMHLSSLIDGLRELSRPRDRSSKVEFADPLPIVRHAMAVCQEIALTAHASIDYQGPGVLPRVAISATELTQILINLVQNGAQAVAARGAPQGKVSIVARTESNMLELCVRDDGVGMPPDVLGRVGTPFFTTRAEGTGLGLAQCQRLIGSAGGRLRIESALGIGTTVTIVLPVAA